MNNFNSIFNFHETHDHRSHCHGCGVKLEIGEKVLRMEFGKSGRVWMGICAGCTGLLVEMLKEREMAE